MLQPGHILFEAPALVKRNMWRGLASFLAYLLVRMALSIPTVPEISRICFFSTIRRLRFMLAEGYVTMVL